MSKFGITVPVFIGGKLNQIPDDNQTSIPVDVTEQLEALGAIVCHRIEDMLIKLIDLIKEFNQ
jgi:hypothetical protein